MAYETGTVSSFKGAFEKLRTFLKSNATLNALSPSQQWEELRYVEDNVESYSTNLTHVGGSMNWLFMPDPRSNYDSSLSAYYVEFQGYVSGTSFIQWKLRTAKPVTSLLMKTNGATINSIVRGFRLQYSDDNSAWTTVTTITGQTGQGLLEERTFSGWAATGSHLYWRIVFDDWPISYTSYYTGKFLCFNGTEIVNSCSAESILRGPGLSGTDQIYIGFRTIYNTGTPYYNIQVHGFTGCLPNEMYIYNQPGACKIACGPPMICLWDGAMTYWISANGRRVVFCFKVSTIYEGGYAGFILPYANPSQYPYPLAIGGSMSGKSTDYKYTNVVGAHSVFCMPGANDGFYGGTGGATTYSDGSLVVMQPTGVWEAYANRPEYYTTDKPCRRGPHSVLPHSFFAWQSTSGSGGNSVPIGENVGGGYVLQPHILYNEKPTPSTYIGELDGTRQISGYQNGAENTGTFGGKDWIIFQNCFRTNIREYWAMVME